MSSVASLPRASSAAHRLPTAAQLRSAALIARVSATIADLLFVAVIALPLGRALGLGLVGQIALFYGIRAFWEIGFVAGLGRTPGRMLLKLYVSRDAEWSRRPSLGRVIIRHFLKSGDAILLLMVAAIAVAVSIGTPTSPLKYFALVLAVPGAIVANVAYLLTPLSLLSGVASHDEHRGLHDRWAKTWVLDTAGFWDSRPMLRSYPR